MLTYNTIRVIYTFRRHNMLVNLNKILAKARQGRYGVGAFNTSNLEIIVKGTEKE